MQASVGAGNSLRVDPPRKLFRLQSSTVNIYTQFDVSTDGRFLVNVWPAVEPQPLTVLSGNPEMLDAMRR